MASLLYDFYIKPTFIQSYQLLSLLCVEKKIQNVLKFDFYTDAN